VSDDPIELHLVQLTTSAPEQAKRAVVGFQSHLMLPNRFPLPIDTTMA
jgi:hypothetical protein